jgi:hypothetical protein
VGERRRNENQFASVPEISIIIFFIFSLFKNLARLIIQKSGPIGGIDYLSKGNTRGGRREKGKFKKKSYLKMESFL